MTIPATLAKFLQSIPGQFRVHRVRAASPHEIPACLEVSASEVVVPAAIKSEQGLWLLALLPADRALDCDRLEALLHRRFDPVDSAEWQARYPDAGPLASCHPFAHLYNLPAIMDRALLAAPWMYFCAGETLGVVSMPGDTFASWFEKVPKVVLSNPVSQTSSMASANSKERYRWQQLQHRLPAMPAMAGKLIVMAQDAEVDIAELAAVIELDPATAAQVIGCARSPLFGYQGAVNSVETAITRVLGLDRVRKLALAIATSRAFSLPVEGKLGLRHFWRHALSTAMLSQMLANKMPQLSLDLDALYLCGLLHNIGVLVTGHVYRGEYKLLSRYLERHPEMSLPDAEKRVAAAVHGEDHRSWQHTALGARLLSDWHLSEEVVVCCEFHHDPVYEGRYKEYVRVVRYANLLLATEGLSDDALQLSLPEPTGLPVTLVDAEEALQTIVQQCHDIDELASALVA